MIPESGATVGEGFLLTGDSESVNIGARMKPWKAAFRAFLDPSGGTRQSVAIALKCSPSKVFYWHRGSVPRDARTLKQIERLSKGAVPASLAAPV